MELPVAVFVFRSAVICVYGVIFDGLDAHACLLFEALAFTKVAVPPVPETNPDPTIVGGKCGNNGVGMKTESPILHL